MHVRKARILAELPNQLRMRRRHWALVAALGTALLGAAAVTTAVPDVGPASIDARPVVEDLGAPRIETGQASDLPFVFDERVEPGDTLPSILQRLGVDDAELVNFVLASAQGKLAVRQLRAGRSISATVRPDGLVSSLSIPLGGGDGRFAVERSADGQLAGRATDGPESAAVIVEMRTATIESSLFGATDAAGLPDEVATKLAELFGTDIDFHTDLRKGDSFSVVYESRLDRGTPVQGGRILAAEFVNQGKRHQVVLFRGTDGREDYYSADGRSLKQAFLRSPLPFTRVTSGFGRRFHPILHNWRTHAGVDFAAPVGTPVKATSDGTVAFAGTQRGYGNIVVLRHARNYATAYAHLSRFAQGLHKGERVSQGDVIAYVGQTGWATGPHLHYEVRIDDVPYDPMRIALPTGQPLSAQERVAFKAQSGPLLERLALLGHVQLAQAR